MKKYKSQSVSSSRIKNIRFPNDIVEGVKEIISKKNCTFSAFVLEAVKNAIKDINNNTEN